VLVVSLAALASGIGSTSACTPPVVGGVYDGYEDS